MFTADPELDCKVFPAEIAIAFKLLAKPGMKLVLPILQLIFTLAIGLKYKTFRQPQY